MVDHNIHSLWMVGWKPCAYTTITWLPPGKVAFSLKTPVQGKPTVILHHQPRKSSPINLYNCSNQSTSFDNSETNKVYRFGAWLDEHIAGDALLQCERNCHIPTDSTVTRQQQAYSFFCCGVKEFDVGCYDAAANWFHKATVYGDPSSRTGGQYQLWTAQALHAAGKRDTAKNALQKLKYHKDRDVRKASQQLLYILGAPQLKLDASHFIYIATAKVPVTKNREKKVATHPGTYNCVDFVKDNYAFVQKTPEKYSLEWFVQKEPPPHSVSRMNTNLVLTLATTIIVSMLVFFYHS